MKKMKIYDFTLVILMAFVAVTGCFASGQDEAVEGTDKPYEITIVIPGEPANDMDVVLDEFYKRTKENLNVTLNFVYAGWDDIGQKVSLKIAAGEKMDAAFLAQWTSPNIQTAAIDEQLLNLDHYFHNDQYPGLKAAFSEEYLSTNKFMGSDGEYHVYGLPFSHELSQGFYVYYRKDLADKYGITIDSIEDLTAYWDAVLKNEPGVTPLSFLGSQNKVANYVEKMLLPVLEKHNVSDSGGVIIKNDGTSYVSKSIIPANDPEYRKYLDDNHPAKVDPFWNYRIAREWFEKGYLEKDLLNQQDQKGPFLSGRAASYFHGAGVFNSVSEPLKEAIPGAELGYFILSDSLRNDIKGQVSASFQAWNFATIPVTCEDPDRVMEFYDWIFSSQENLDLLEYGVEGKHWTADGDTQYTAMTNPDTGKSYNFGGYVMTWNPTMRRIPSDVPSDVIEFMLVNSSEEYFYKDPGAGFSFINDNVKTEEALINEINSIRIALANGLIENIEEYVAEADAKLLKAGIEVFAEEYENQFDAFLLTHPYLGQ